MIVIISGRGKNFGKIIRDDKLKAELEKVFLTIELLAKGCASRTWLDATECSQIFVKCICFLQMSRYEPLKLFFGLRQS